MRRAILAIAIVVLAALPAAAGAGTILSGTYATKIASGPLKGTWSIDFASPNYTVTFQGMVGVRGRFAISGQRITFHDTGGPQACSGSGVYTFKLAGRRLQFTRVSDPAANCAGRRGVLAQTFTKSG